jgi:hypothetical protein
MGERLWRALLLAAMGFALSACGVVSTPFGGREALVPHPTYKIGAPYTVNGTTYYPRVDYAYDQTGLASWYGGGFQGRYTANGEIFDLNDLTAAHTTLPLPSIVEVVNLQNNRAIRPRADHRPVAPRRAAVGLRPHRYGAGQGAGAAGAEPYCRRRRGAWHRRKRRGGRHRNRCLQTATVTPIFCRVARPSCPGRAGRERARRRPFARPDDRERLSRRAGRDRLD